MKKLFVGLLVFLTVSLSAQDLVDIKFIRDPTIEHYFAKYNGKGASPPWVNGAPGWFNGVPVQNYNTTWYEGLTGPYAYRRAPEVYTVLDDGYNGPTPLELIVPDQFAMVQGDLSRTYMPANTQDWVTFA